MLRTINLILISSFLSIASIAQKPNVVFILVDDMGYGDLGAYGQKHIETPNLDKLAAGGMKFTQFYAGTSVCAPSRASLMTGLHTGHTSIRGNLEIEPEGQSPLPDSVQTLAEMFKKADYATGTFGKWGLGFPGSEGDPIKQGVDVFYGYNCQRQSHNYYPTHLWSNDKKVLLENTITQQTKYAPDLIQQQALDFIEKHQKNPFFAFLTYTLPHAGLQIPTNDKMFQYYKTKFNEKPIAVGTTWDGSGYQPQAYPRAAYATMVSKLDNYVGEVIEKLRKVGLSNNTLIIFASDNGPHVEGGNDPTFFNSSGGFKGVKRSLNEGGIRVPLIASWPGKIKAGSVSNYVGAFWDFFPTFLAITGQKQVQKTDGFSLLPALLKGQQNTKHKFLYWEFHEDGGRQAVRIGDWKGIREKVKKNPNGKISLYNLKDDPSERKDLANEQTALVKQIEAIMKREHVENATFPFIK